MPVKAKPRKSTMSNISDISEKINMVKKKGVKRVKLLALLEQSTLLEHLIPNVFDQGSGVKGYAYPKGHEKGATVHVMYRAKFPEEFNLRITKKNGDQETMDLAEFKDVKGIELLDHRTASKQADEMRGRGKYRFVLSRREMWDDWTSPTSYFTK